MSATLLIPAAAPSKSRSVAPERSTRPWLGKNGGTLLWNVTGETEELVFNVGVNPDNGAVVNLNTCETSVPAEGRFDTLCDVWTDPDFEADEPAFYYARVVENPSCRWSHRLCLETAVDCGSEPPASELFRSCCTDDLDETVQERAWTSPIWYLPPR